MRRDRVQVLISTFGRGHLLDTNPRIHVFGATPRRKALLDVLGWGDSANHRATELQKDGGVVVEEQSQLAFNGSLELKVLFVFGLKPKKITNQLLIREILKVEFQINPSSLLTSVF